MHWPALASREVNMTGRRWTIALVLMANPLMAYFVRSEGQATDWMPTFTFLGVVALLAIALSEKETGRR
jgi:hypothetical protein